MKKSLTSIGISLVSTFIFISLMSAQNISISNQPAHTPDASAVLDVHATDAGMLTPRLTRVQRDAIPNPAIGLLIYQMDEQSGFYFFDETSWKIMGGKISDLSSDLIIGQQDENTSIPEYLWDPINGSSSYDTSGIIYDSGGAEGDYFNNQDSYFYIYPPNWPDMNPQLGIQLEIISMDIDDSDSLLIVVYDGISSFSDWYKGSHSNVQLPFGSERAIMRFVSDGSQSAPGFEIRYDWVYPPSDTTGGTSEKMGWFYEPARNAMRGGVDFIGAWQLDSIGQGTMSYGENVKATGHSAMALGKDSRARGDYSISLGQESKADGIASFAAAGGEAESDLSTAIGPDSRARGPNSVAIGDAYTDGYQSVSLGGGAIGNYSFSTGRYTKAEGQSSSALGYFNEAEGNYATTSGYRNMANSAYETVFGRYNKELFGIDPSAWVSEDPLFVIGNGIGSSFSERSNALTLLKNSHLGLGLHNPSAPLHVKSGTKTTGTQTMAIFEADSVNRVQMTLRPMLGTDFQIEGNGDGNEMYFRRSNTLMTLDWDNAGRVGIGTTSPQSKLHIEGTLEIDNTIKANDSDGLSFKNANGILAMKVTSDGVLAANEQIDALNDNGLAFGTNDGTKRLFIADNGNVGIGSLLPNSKLFVNGRLELQKEIKANGSAGLALLTDDNISRVSISDNGNVGIGTTSPTSKLHIEGTLEIDDQIRADDASGINFASDEGTIRLHLNDNGRIGIGIGNAIPDAQLSVTAQGTNDAMRVRTPAGTKFRVFNNGNVRIGQNSGSTSSQLNINSFADVSPLRVQVDGGTKLMVHSNGGVSVGSSTAPGANGIRVAGSYAAKSGGGSWTATSDIRLKTVHEKYLDGLEQVLKISPVKYSYNEQSGYRTDEDHIGVVAQELAEIAPYMIGTLNQDGEDYLTVDNSAMVYMLINAVKEQQTMIEELKKEIADMRK